MARHTIVIDVPDLVHPSHVEEHLTKLLTDEPHRIQGYLANVEVVEYHHEDVIGASEYPPCETCKEPIDYCQGHGEIAADVQAGR